MNKFVVATSGGITRIVFVEESLDDNDEPLPIAAHAGICGSNANAEALAKLILKQLGYNVHLTRVDGSGGGGGGGGGVSMQVFNASGNWQKNNSGNTHFRP
jgi:hypothetical protein